MRPAPRRPAPALVVVASCAAFAASACGTTPVQVLSLVAGPDAGVDGPAVSVAPPALGTQQEYCAGNGPPVLVDSAGDAGPVSTCPDQLAQRAFRYALCTCEGYVSDHALVTDAFDGANAPYDPSTATAGGSVGVNGDLHPTGLMQIGGSLWASTSMTITTSTVEVSGELHAQGELRPTPSLSVQADAWMASGIQTNGDLTVKGTLHLPTGQINSVDGMKNYTTVDGMWFQLAPACDCDASHFVDVAGIVATYEEVNDDIALHVGKTMLANVQTDLTMPLGCGRIFLTEIGANQASIHLTVQGRVALFVAGDLSTSDFEIDVPSGSELDFFVAGNLVVNGVFRVGDPSNPARARTYVGGTSVNLQGAATLAGNLYAPGATLTIGGTAPTILYGSVFAKTLSLSSDLAIHYDEAILASSPTRACAAPVTCTTCNDCNGQACNVNTGTCGACHESDQCCPPLVCGPQGTCVSDVIPR